MAFLRRNSTAFEMHRDRITAFGSSAGGHLAAMLAVIPPGDDLGSTAELDVVDTVPNAVICYCPVTNLHQSMQMQDSQEPPRDFVRVFLGVPESTHEAVYTRASPYDRIRGNEPPFLVIHGDQDKVIPVSHSVDFCDRINSRGGLAEMVVLQNAGHGFGYGITTEAQKAAVQHAVAFLNRVASSRPEFREGSGRRHDSEDAARRAPDVGRA